MSLALRNGWVVTQNPNREIIRADVLIEGNRIASIGEVGGADEVLDVSGCAVIPGLINGHTHVSMSILRGIADDVNLDGFLERTFRVDAMRTPDDVEVGAELGAVEMLLAGTTSFVDMYYDQDRIASAVERTGIRGFLGWAVLDREFTTQEGEPLDNCRRFMERFRGRERIHPMVALQGVYVCSEDTLLAARDLAGDQGVPYHMHLSETRKEVYEHQARTGMRPAEWLASIGFLGPGFIGAHGAWLTINEIRALASAGAGMVHCPVSNMKLASGFEAPVPEMQAHGMAVGLGTDGASSQNRLDMWGEMKTCALLHKAQRLDATVMDAQRVLDMATVEGARAIKMGEELGSIEPGKLADLAVIDLKHPAMVPTYPENLVSNLVYSCQSDCVRHVIVNGRPVVVDRKLLTADLDEIHEKGMQSSKRFFEIP